MRNVKKKREGEEFWTLRGGLDDKGRRRGKGKREGKRESGKGGKEEEWSLTRKKREKRRRENGKEKGAKND